MDGGRPTLRLAGGVPLRQVGEQLVGRVAVQPDLFPAALQVVAADPALAVVDVDRFHDVGLQQAVLGQDFGRDGQAGVHGLANSRFVVPAVLGIEDWNAAGDVAALLFW